MANLWLLSRRFVGAIQVSIGVRAGGGPKGDCSPPPPQKKKIGGNSGFLGKKRNLGKASF